MDVNATDKDIGDNAKISFSIVHGSDGKFGINETTGVVYVAQNLDREKQDRYTVSKSITFSNFTCPWTFYVKQPLDLQFTTQTGNSTLSKLFCVKSLTWLQV